MKKNKIGILNSNFQLKNDWNIYSLKYLLKTKITDGPHETPEFIDEGIPFLSVDSISDGKLTFENCRYISKEDYKKYKIKCNPQKNDIFMGKAASIGKIAIVDVDFPFSIWSPLALIRPNIKKIIPKFLEYSLKSSYAQDQIDQYSTSNTQKNISMADIPRIKIIVPRINEQEQIAKYLDKKTTKIEQTITKNKKLITLLKEKRTSLINQTVTKGLNPDAPMKESGIKWIGKIPEHWINSQLRAYFIEHKNKNKSLKETNLLSLSYGKIIRKDINTKEGLLPENFENYNVIKKDYIVLRLTDLQNDKKSLRTGLCTEKGIITSAYVTIKSFKEINSIYVHYLLHSYDINKIFYTMGAGVRQNMNFEEFSRLPLLIPEINEQKEIVEYLNNQTKLIDKTIEKIEKNIELLEEYKESLIHHVVTGKIDVRGVEV